MATSMRFPSKEFRRFIPGLFIAGMVVVTVSVLVFISVDDKEAPKAVIIIEPEEIRANSAITFDGTNSTDPDGDDDDLEYRWTLDEKITVEMPIFKYSFPEEGNFTVVLQVTDSSGLTDTETLFVSVL
jgi:hypothetical protein